MDSSDYARALDEILPSVAQKKNDRGENGYMVLGPDSGDPIEAVLMALAAAEKVFGSTVNSKGFKVIKGCGGKSSSLSRRKSISQAHRLYSPLTTLLSFRSIDVRLFL